MENCIVIDGLTSCCTHDLLRERLQHRFGRVLRIEALPECTDAVLLQFGLENVALDVMGSGLDDLKSWLPSKCSTLGLADDTSMVGNSLRIRPPFLDEYIKLSTNWRKKDRMSRVKRCIELGGDGVVSSYFEHDFVFEDVTTGSQATSDATYEGCNDAEGESSGFRLKLRIDMNVCGTGSTLWTCGLLHAECLWQGLVAVKGKRVLELGCGCAAVPSIVAVKRGAASVFATDVVSEVLMSAGTNASCHGVNVRRLDWSDHIGVQSVNVCQADIVIWSDVVYTEFGGYLLAKAVLAHVAPGGIIAAVVPDEDRPGMIEFEHLMLDAGFLRSRDEQIPFDVYSSANERFGLSEGLVSVSKGSAAQSRLIVWQVPDLYD
eukprot:TRINITY_DN56846_c0_g1_i1.p1 TRINITY_DN56846_c0_g1~~TRINITY_DN56846_c0_g1_i1.p1  ORF type:complete len:376 (+),score=49.73 TRINITY_DN56846_c0_g1_i1:50-1177(+)